MRVHFVDLIVVFWVFFSVKIALGIAKTFPTTVKRKLSCWVIVKGEKKVIKTKIAELWHTQSN